MPSEVAVPLDEDHISICKPASCDAQLYSVVAEIDKGLSGTQYLVLCYSSAGPSDWTDREWHSTLHRQLSGHPVKILPARLSGGGPPAILADIKYADLVAHWDQGVKDLLRAIR
ncbi:MULTISPECIES: TIR domain-containing protein [unclassified Thiocapsa]|uniref:TIR domain-containing protein n=1 Tax=unclassified Thiocapsa TaxID=2641286 RepID=UPI0035B2A330